MAIKSMPLLKKLVIAAIGLFLADYVGLFVHLMELDYTRYFELPTVVVDESNVNESDVTSSNNNNKNNNIIKANKYYDYQFLQKAINKCTIGATAPHLTVLVKSALKNEERRNVIRRTWGYERRFSDVNYRCVFLLGAASSSGSGGDDDDATIMMTAIRDESLKHGDIVQGDFEDSYFNNTIKTMLGIRWAKEYCIGSDFYMFVDDDYYVSIKNILKFIAYPELYPNAISGLWSKKQHQYMMQQQQQQQKSSTESENERLFAGYVMQSAPLRHKFSKWYVSLREYPYDMWPPYVTAGAFVLSNNALTDLYAAGRTIRPFRFDDIYLSMLALSAKLRLTHCDMFYFKPPYYNGAESYQYVLAAHGFDDSKHLEKVWTECRAAGYA